MEITKLKISKIDLEESKIETVDHTTYGTDFDSYLMGLIKVIMDGGSGRTFCFERETTEVRAQITRLIAGVDFDDIVTVISNRLLTCEKTAQEKMAKLKVEIQKGIVVHALVADGDLSKFVICKAEHNEFLNETDFKLAKGLPVKKKVFKAVICFLSETALLNVLVYDINQTQYWWKEFLELTKVHSDEDNTENAFDAIDRGVLAKIKKEFPQDYTYIRNSTVRYFRAKENFDMQDYLDNGIGDYKPYDERLKVDELKQKIKSLPETSKEKFDNQFKIIKDRIKARFINKIPLTNQIELHLKEDIQDISSVITAVQDSDGTKYVKIKSIDGYKYFHNLAKDNSR